MGSFIPFHRSASTVRRHHTPHPRPPTPNPTHPPPLQNPRVYYVLHIIQYYTFFLYIYTRIQRHNTSLSEHILHTLTDNTTRSIQFERNTKQKHAHLSDCICDYTSTAPCVFSIIDLFVITERFLLLLLLLYVNSWLCCRQDSSPNPRRSLDLQNVILV